MRRAWRGGAPRTSHALPHFISAFTLSYTALFDSLFAPLLFLSRSSASSYLCYTYFVNETVLLAPLPLRSTDISISTFVALSRIFTLPRFSAITFRNAASSPPYFLPLWFRGCKRFSRISPRRVVHVCRFIRQTGRKERVIIKTPRDPRPCIYDTAAVSVLRTVSLVDYLRLLHV